MEAKDLLNYFNEKLFISDLKATTKEEALIEIVTEFEKLHLIKTKDILLEMLRQREALGTTGIGKGIAIPHGRTTVVKDVMIAFAKSNAGLDYSSMDDQPVHLIFMVIAPPVEESNKYLPVLGKLVEVLNNHSTREKIMAVKTYDELIKCMSEV